MQALVSATTAAFKQSATYANSIHHHSTIQPPRLYALGHNFKTELVQIPASKQRTLLLNNLHQQAYRSVQLLCQHVDYCNLNTVTVKDAQPLSWIDDTMESLGMQSGSAA